MKNVLGVLFLFLFLGCNNNTNIEVRMINFSRGETHAGRTLVFPGELGRSLAEEFNSYKYMLVLYYDSTQCAPCAIDKLKILRHYKEDFEELHIKILLVVEHSSEEYINGIRQSLKYPVLMDTVNFREAVRSVGHHSFVIDKNKNVVGFGYPIESEETWKSFKQIMKNRR